MSETPFFSVIVPACNVEAYIENTIRSILEQTCPDFELILVNDGSTDGTGAICLKYARAYPQKICCISQENHGVSNARNRGMDVSKGRYLTFVDGDDYLARDALERMKACLQEKNSDLFYCDFLKTEHLAEEASDPASRKAQVISREECILDKLKEKTIPVYAACYSRAMARKEHIRFDEELSFIEDALFFFTCVMHAAEIVYDPAVLYYYVQRKDSVSHRKDDLLREIRCELKGWKKIEAQLSADRKIRRLLLPRIRKIQRNYWRLRFFRLLRRIVPPPTSV